MIGPSCKKIFDFTVYDPFLFGYNILTEQKGIFQMKLLIGLLCLFLINFVVGVIMILCEKEYY